MQDTVRVLVTGGKGMLGSAFAKQVRDFPYFDMRSPDRSELDVRDPEAVAGWREWIAGGWIVHCAAIVDVEGCARDPDAARETIVGGTRNIVELARRSGARLLYPQSFLVYDGHENPIPEETEPQPLSLYGELKYEAERAVASALDDALMVRMAGFFGGEDLDKNFVGRIIPVMRAAMLRGQSEFEVGDRIWQPTWTEDLAFNSMHLMARGSAGRYQMACVDCATFAEIAHEITLALGWRDRLRVVSVDASRVSQSELGRRPDVAILSCRRLTDEGINLQRSWRSTLHAYLAAPFFNQYRMEVQA